MVFDKMKKYNFFFKNFINYDYKDLIENNEKVIFYKV